MSAADKIHTFQDQYHTQCYCYVYLHDATCAVDGSQLVAGQWTAHDAAVALSQSQSVVLPDAVGDRFGLSQRFSMHNNQENIVRI